MKIESKNLLPPFLQETLALTSDCDSLHIRILDAITPERERSQARHTGANTVSVSHKDELLTSSFNQINTSVTYA